MTRQWKPTTLKLTANPVFSLTDLGWRVAGALRRHIAETRASGTFRWPPVG